MRVLIIIFLALLCLWALGVFIAAVAIFMAEENISEVVYGEVWDDASK